MAESNKAMTTPRRTVVCPRCDGSGKVVGPNGVIERCTARDEPKATDG